ncbi:Vgb family protein [Leifsonia poae]|uniref:Vgb family protein n=1 Tax=Leifsonia poae TaxID=110933 RepID=UPI001CBFA9DE|nr:virginiamycin B lyase [Leifsonia poae]
MSARTFVEHPVGEAGEGPYAVAVTRDGALWFTLVHGGRVGRRGPDGSLAYLSLGEGSQPSLLAAATDSTVWVTDTTGNRLVHLGVERGGVVLVGAVAVPTPGAQPFGVVSLDDGTAWFTELGADALGRIDILGRVEEFPVGRDGAVVSMIAASGDSLWFTMNGGNAVGHVRGGDAAIAFTELPRIPSGPVGIAVAENGAVWVAEILADTLGRIARNGTLTEFPLPAGAKPHAVAADPRGGVWVSLWGTGQLAHTTDDGELSFFDLPTAESEPHGLVVGDDGAVWTALESGALAALLPEPSPESVGIRA